MGTAAASPVVVIDADGAASSASCDDTTAAPRTVTAALAAVAAGGTVAICPGTLVEPGQVVVDRDVTVRAADPARPPVITPGADTGVTGDDRGWWLVRAGVSLTLRDVRLDGAGRRLHQGLRFRGRGSVHDVTFTDIAYAPTGPEHSGFAVVAFGDGPVLVTGSTFRRIGRVGALFYGPAVVGSVFAGNTYVGKGVGAHLDYGVEVGAGAVVTVADSTITRARGEAAGAVSAGVLVSTAFGGGSGVTVSRSTLADNANGVFLDDASGRGLGPIEVSRNRIGGNAVRGVARAGGGPVDATCNWWGAPDGPRTHGGSGDGVAAGVEVVPFLTSDDLSGRCAVEPLVRSDTDEVVVAEGARAEVSGTFEAGSATPVTLTASSGTVTSSGGNRGVWTWSATPDDGPSDTTPVTVTADNGAEGTTSFSLVVRNVAPTATFEAPGTAFTDRAFPLALRGITEPSPADRAAGLAIAFDCGSGDGYAPAGSETATECHVDRGGRRTVRARIADRDGGTRELTAVVAVYSPEGDGAPDRSAAGTVGPRGVVATGDGEATPSDPIVTRVRVPSGGEVTIEEGPPVGGAPEDHTLLTWGATITAPDQTSIAPLELTFRLDADLLPDPIPGTGAITVAPVLDGVIVPPCAEDRIEPPCVERRSVVGDDLVLVVRATTAGAVTFAVPTRACPAVGVPPTRFGDVRGTAHEPAVACAEAWALVRGLTDDAYDPGGAVTRAQVATTVARLLGLAGVELPASPPDRFGDDDGSVHELAIGQLAELGVMEGRGERTFAPAASLTRAQFASTLARAYAVLLDRPLAEGPDRFRDDDGSVHEPSIDAAAAAGLANGVGGDRFAPHAPVRRDQTASFLTRLLDAWYVDFRG